MFKDQLVELLTRHLEVSEATEADPFGARVSCCIGPQGKSVAMARDLCMRKNSCLVFTPRLTSTFSHTISGIDVQIVMILKRMYGVFKYKDGSMKENSYFSDFMLAFFGTPDAVIKEILEEMGIVHGVTVMWVQKYMHIETAFQPRPPRNDLKKNSPFSKRKMKGTK
jgi:hypothetical protein